MNIGFLILHYKTIDETLGCVQSILNLDSKYQKKIYIVDNFSNDESSKRLKNIENNNIKVIYSDENLGFSKGNNLGFSYIKKHDTIKYLIVCNNDIIFKQKDFLYCIDEIFKKEHFDILGPDIFAFKKNLHQSPIRTTLPKISSVEKEILELTTRLSLYKKNINVENIGLKNKIRNKINKTFAYKLFRYFKLLINREDIINYKKFYSHACIYGACIIFSDNFINQNSKLFYPETFFYGEEELLFLRASYYNWKIIYDPMIQVLHLDESSANESYKNFYSKKIFQTEQLIKVRKKYIEYYNELRNRNEQKVNY